MLPNINSHHRREVLTIDQKLHALNQIVQLLLIRGPGHPYRWPFLNQEILNEKLCGGAPFVRKCGFAKLNLIGRGSTSRVRSASGSSGPAGPAAVGSSQNGCSCNSIS